MNGHFAIRRLLLATALPIEAKIHKACIEGNTEEVVRLMNSKIAISIDDINQKKTLLVAVGNQNVAIVRELLKLKVDVDVRDEDDDYTPMHMAAQAGNLTIVQDLLKHGAKVNPLADDGISVLWLAICVEKYQIAELLIKHGATFIGYKGNLLDPSAEGYYGVCKVLLENGANVDGDGDVPETPLHHAAENGHLEIVELLIKNGANVNFPDENHQTPFHGAVVRNRADSVKRFFELGTNLDLNNRNQYGRTAFEDAVKKNLGGILKMLMYDNH